MARKPRNILQLLKDESGTAFIEFGLLASIFITLSFVVIVLLLMRCALV